MIIADEKKYVEDILREGSKPSNMSVKGLIRYIARYYYEKFKDEDLNTYIRYVLDVIGMMNMSLLEYQEYRFADFTRQYCKRLRDGSFPHELREVSEISFTEEELKIINSAVYRKERKVLFALYALAKIYSPTLGWINCSETDIFKYANVHVTYKEKLQILHALYNDGLIEINHMIDKSGYRVNLVPDSPVAYVTKDLNDFGKQYLSMTSKESEPVHL
ncbi:hypothetical protein [Butyrivibrio sp. INlla21]|uniref:hypothetical protein n=1 Tax=Butyrivibrio sp. INlla21 TaxID=1520811 RepID=UPI0008E3C6EE|nr:hypothetical protein [Butyrivibrio sp. INlla21]SFU36586.1 hypothetical protein SAMN02910342_00264 [Butyrivibrio sp. INlla21]